MATLAMELSAVWPHHKAYFHKVRLVQGLDKCVDNPERTEVAPLSVPGATSPHILSYSASVIYDAGL